MRNIRERIVKTKSEILSDIDCACAHDKKYAYPCTPKSVGAGVRALTKTKRHVKRTIQNFVAHGESAENAA